MSSTAAGSLRFAFFPSPPVANHTSISHGSSYENTRSRVSHVQAGLLQRHFGGLFISCCELYLQSVLNAAARLILQIPKLSVAVWLALSHSTSRNSVFLSVKSRSANDYARPPTATFVPLMSYSGGTTAVLLHWPKGFFSL